MGVMYTANPVLEGSVKDASSDALMTLVSVTEGGPKIAKKPTKKGGKADSGSVRIRIIDDIRKECGTTGEERRTESTGIAI